MTAVVFFAQILFGGASAGGLGMLSNVDYVAKMVKPAKIFGYNDGGWFTLYRNFLEPKGYGSPVFLSSLHYVRMIIMFHIVFYVFLVLTIITINPCW